MQTSEEGSRASRRNDRRSIPGTSHPFRSRLGYHFSTLDASCGRKTNRGYISFRFKGGAASPEKRFRRAEFIARILTAHWRFGEAAKL